MANGLIFYLLFLMLFSMKQSLCPIVSNTEVMPGVYLMWLDAPAVARGAVPGQFITVGCEGLLLRRPFSIHQVDSKRLAILFKVVGAGTLWLSKQKAGKKVDVLGPLGRGFSLAPGSESLLLVGGGMGIAPLIFLAQYAAPGHTVALVHGAKTAAQIYHQGLPRGVEFIPVTEDGTLGAKGRATDVLPDFLGGADRVFACGPLDMYKAMSEQIVILSEAKNLSCQVSLEVRMGCGLGACRSCTINTRKGLKQVCRDGPVFELGDILWKEVKI